jgi:hypothetical protein
MKTKQLSINTIEFENDIKEKKSAYGRGGNDENHTPPEAVRPILQFIPKDKIVWCPFDTEQSEYVKQISETNEVVFSHIETGKNFYDYEPKEWDICISNPPFSNKNKIFERLLRFGKPFCMLMTFAILRDKPIHKKSLKYGWDYEIIWFNERVRYIEPLTGIQKEKPTFISIYLCRDFLPKQNITLDLSKYKETYLKQMRLFDEN